MPNVIEGANTPEYVGEPLKYTYPEGLDLSPQGALHQRVLENILKRVRVSHEKMSARRDSWRQIDKTLSAYIPLSDAERLVKDHDSRSPVSIVFPHSYSILETLTAFMDGLFFERAYFSL